MQVITGPKLFKYFKSHVRNPSKFQMYESQFVTLDKDLHVFKKVYSSGVEAIANLIIPTGAVVYVSHFAFDEYSTRKMRASRAFVHSIYTLEGNKLNLATSSFEYFEYRPNTIVTPDNGFSYIPDHCQSGIHFFLNMQDAYDY